MSTVAEIEAAIAELPPEERMEIRRWMDVHATKPEVSEALRMFRQLQAEVKLTPQRATDWKNAVADARR